MVDLGWASFSLCKMVMNWIPPLIVLLDPISYLVYTMFRHSRISDCFGSKPVDPVETGGGVYFFTAVDGVSRFKRWAGVQTRVPGVPCPSVHTNLAGSHGRLPPQCHVLQILLTHPDLYPSPKKYNHCHFLCPWRYPFGLIHSHLVLSTNGDGSKPIILYLEGMNIHLPGKR